MDDPLIVDFAPAIAILGIIVALSTGAFQRSRDKLIAAGRRRKA
jgi:hypothetical protein